MTDRQDEALLLATPTPSAVIPRRRKTAISSPREALAGATISSSIVTLACSIQAPVDGQRPGSDAHYRSRASGDAEAPDIP
jgi:hypothetical protein